jgi:hypothetical protein
MSSCIKFDDASDDAPDLHIGGRTTQQCGKNKERNPHAPNGHAQHSLVVIKRKLNSNSYEENR